MTFIQVDEYALAVLCWVASAAVLFSKSVHWKGIAGRPFLTRALRALFVFLALAFVPVSVVWTQAKRTSKPWSNLLPKSSSEPISVGTDALKMALAPLVLVQRGTVRFPVKKKSDFFSITGSEPCSGYRTTVVTSFMFANWRSLGISMSV
jgi:hypothetical protein